MKMWSRLLLVLACIAAVPGFAREQQSAKSLLWRISSRDMQKPSYLFGTMHLICPQDYIWTDTMQAMLQKTDAVCFEMDLDAPDIYEQVARGMINDEQKKLKDYFTEEQYQALSKYLADSVGVDISVFQMMKPVAIQTLLAERALGCQMPVSYEANIMQVAKSRNMEVIGLERPDEQLDLFDNLPADSVIKDLLNIVTGNNETKDEYDQLICAYKNQDLPGLHKLIAASGQHDLDLGGFLDTRNEKWIPRMVEKMDERSIFFAVGAGHLWGDMGLIKLLQKSGYTVEPVK